MVLVDDEKETKWEEWSSLTVKRVSNQQNNVLKLLNLKAVSINLKHNNLAGGSKFEKVNWFLVDEMDASKPTVENKIYVLPTSTCRDLVGTTSPTEFLGPSRRLKTDNKILYITNK